jgi:hypothetical protein
MGLRPPGLSHSPLPRSLPAVLPPPHPRDARASAARITAAAAPVPAPRLRRELPAPRPQRRRQPRRDMARAARRRPATPEHGAAGR